MPRSPRNRSLGKAFLLAATWMVGCGGRTPAGDPNADPNNPGAPPPTCAEICSHVIGTCASGANIDACVSDCETTNMKFVTCAELHPYLRCMATTAVECSKGEVVILGCSNERGALESCLPR